MAMEEILLFSPISSIQYPRAAVNPASFYGQRVLTARIITWSRELHSWWKIQYVLAQVKLALSDICI